MGKWGQLTPLEKMDEKLKSENMQKRGSFLNILRAIKAGRCRERRYADHIFIQIYFRMHHFVVKFSKFSSPQAARGHWPPPTKVLRTHLLELFGVIDYDYWLFRVMTALCTKQVSAVADWPAWRNRDVHRAWRSLCNKLQRSSVGVRRYCQLSWPTLRSILSRSERPPFKI